MTWENIVHNVGTIYGHDIRNGMQNKTKVSIPKPDYTEDVQSKHKQRVEVLSLQSVRISEAREANRVMLNQAVEDGNDPEAPINLAMLENEIDRATYKASIDPAIHLTGAKKTEHDNIWRMFINRRWCYKY